MLKRLKRKKGRRGAIEDMFLVLVVIFGLAIGFLVMGYVVPLIGDAMRDTPINDSSAARLALATSENIAVNYMDKVYLFVFAFLCIGVLITSFLIDVHPIFIPIYIILLAMVVVVSVILNYTYTVISTETMMNATASGMTYTNTIMNNLIPIMIGVGVLSMIIIFGKMRMAFGAGGSAGL